MNDNINVCIIHYNTPMLTECLIKSINKFTPGCNIYVFDNSDMKPFKCDFDNVTLFDNTNGQYVNFDVFLMNYPDRFKSGGSITNNFGSAKHCYSVQKCIELINENFVLMDSDILIKRDFSDIIDEEYIACGSIINRFRKSRLCPFLCYLNVRKMNELGITYFDDEHMHGLYMSKEGEDYDTGAWILEELSNTNGLRCINVDDYMFHYRGGSWSEYFNRKDIAQRFVKDRPYNMSQKEWLEIHSELWLDEKIIITMTSWKLRIQNIPTVLDTVYSQTRLPDKIVINLSSDEFKDGESSIPKDVLTYIKEHDNIEINWISGKNTRQWKKTIPTMIRYPNDCIICIDDDRLYAPNFIESLYKKHLESPNNPITVNHSTRYLGKYLQHAGHGTLDMAKFYKNFSEISLDDELFGMASSDTFFNYLSVKYNNPIIYCGKNIDIKMFNEVYPLRETEKTYDASSHHAMWNFLVKRYGEITSENKNVSTYISLRKHKKTKPTRPYRP